MMTESIKRRTINPGSIIILAGLSISLILYITAPFIFSLSISNRDLRTLAYILIAFPLPLLTASNISGRRYGIEMWERVKEDLVTMIFSLSLIMFYAIIQASPGALGVVVFRGSLFVLALALFIYGLTKWGYTRGCSTLDPVIS